MRKAVSLLFVSTILTVIMVGCSANKEIATTPSPPDTQVTEYSKPEEQISESNAFAPGLYPTPTNTELSFGFLDHTIFTQYWTDGTYRCGSDFPAGDYYIMSIYGANAMYGVSDNPNDFTWSSQRVFRKVSVKEGQYVKVMYGGIMVPANEVDSSNWETYGVFLVGKDLPEGDYKIVTISDYCDSDIAAIQGAKGAYQICDSSPDSDPISCDPLFESQSYISVKNGQYLIINDLQLTLCGADPVAATSEQQSDTKSSIAAEETSPSEAEFVRLSVIDANAVLDEEIDKYETLLDDLTDIIDYWKTHNLINDEEIKSYETMWETMANKAAGIETVLTENRPPIEYDSIWLEIRDCLGKIAELCSKGINQDINGDGKYSKEEMLNFLQTTGQDVLDQIQEVINISNRLNAMPTPEVSSNGTTVSTAQPTHLCEECGNIGEHSIVSPFSGQTEYYCTKHYNELQDLINQVSGSNSSQKTNTSASTSKPSEINTARHNDKEAWSCAMNIVEGSLKAPSTAKFCSYVDAKVTHLGNGEYKVTGWVDSQNSYGAMMRSNFTVTYTATEKGYKNGSVAFS